MTYLIDANAIIYLVSGKFPDLAGRVEATPKDDILISTIVLAELALGSANGTAPPPDVLDRLVRQMPIVDFDEAAARAYARLPFKRGRFDRLLAAHALSLGAGIITSNRGGFADIPDLRVEDWTKP